MNSIEMNAVEMRLGSFHLGPIDLEIPRGAFVGLIGENGAGKSTLIKVLLGIMPSSAGSISVLGHDPVTGDPSYKERVGFVFDELHLPAQYFNAKHVGKLHALLYKNTWEPETFAKFLERFELPAKKKIKAYSRGMRMKLSLAIALSHGAELLILDEPTGGLDPVVRDEVLDVILEFLQDERRSVLFSSHILSDLDKAADYIAFLHKGKLLLMEGKDELTEKYALLHASPTTLGELDPEAVIGRRHSEFGDTALVQRALVPAGFELEKPTIEDVMVYLVKGGNR